MSTVEFFNENYLNREGDWHPCKPRKVLTVSQAYNLWLPLCEDIHVFFLTHWIETDDFGFLYAGSTRFEFVYGQVSEFKQFEVTVITEPENYRRHLNADSVVLYWHAEDWS